VAKFDEQQLAFIEAVATGSKLYEAYLDVYGGEGFATQTLRNRAKVIATPEVRKAIEERKLELQQEAAKNSEITTIKGNPDNITKEALLENCDYIIQNTKPCIFKKLNGVPITNRDAAGVYLKAVELAAKITGAFEKEEKVDGTVVVQFAQEVEDLSR
jgi:ferritin-like metal-binding protein YciE